MPPAKAVTRSVDAWLDEIHDVVVPPPGDVLDGRDVVFGAALLEADVFRRLAKKGEFLRTLEHELRERGSVLTRRGEERLRVLRTPSEAVPTLRDDPATLDELGREVLADVLTKRILRVREGRPRRVPKRVVWWRRLKAALPGPAADEPTTGWEGDGQRCFLVHIDAPWGAGKTSLLGFLGTRLRAEGWVVVDFNAWEHQRIVPPWWWLMTKLHDDGRRAVGATSPGGALTLWLYDVWWRIRDGWAIYLAAPLVAVLAFVLYRRGFFGSGIEGAGEWAKSAGAVLAFAIAVVGTIRGLNRWFVGGSEGAAASLLRRTRDPMRLVKHRFHELVHAAGRPVAIFIDDLDRCKAEFVVELLEGIQTLFANEPVVYVVAADGDWIRDCYTQVYKDFCANAAEPGRPLGWLFLEKTFQETVRLPRIPDTTRKEFWRRLLTQQKHDGLADGTEHELAAERLFEGKGTPGEVGMAMKQAQAEGRIGLRHLQRAAALQLESEAVEAHTKHTLDTFGHLLEDNPRAMKKLINAYGIQRDLLVLEDPDLLINETRLRQLALWTITSLRWPLLADYLEDHPEAVDTLRAGSIPALGDAPKELERVVRDPTLRAVVQGSEVDPAVQLDQAAVRRFVGLDGAAVGRLH